MKNLLLALLLAFGVQSFAQQVVSVFIHVQDTSGLPVANQAIIGSYQSPQGTITLSVITDVNGNYIDSALISSQSTMTYYTIAGGCADSAVFFTNPATFFYSDTLVVCGNGSGSGGCNYSVSALPVAGFPNRAFFSYTGGNPGASSYFWDFGDGNISTQPSPFHTYAQPGTYYYCLTIDSCAPVCDSITVFGGGGCDPFFFPVVNGNTVDIFPSLLTGQFEAIVDWGDGQLDTFTPQNIPVLPANISHTYSAPGNYSICFTHSNVNLGCSRTYCDSVSVNTGSSPCQALWTVDTLNSINFAGNVMLWNLSTGGTASNPLNYIWDWGDGTTSTGPYPMHTYSDTGIYYVCLTVNDPVSGCVDTYCDSLGFDADGNLIYKSTTFTGFTVMVIDPATIGTEELNLEVTVEAYPNPSNGEISIMSEQSRIIDVSIFDLSGRMIQVIHPVNNQDDKVELNITEQGMYILRINTESGTLTKRILVN